MSRDFEIRQADTAFVETATGWLADSGLPTEDLTAAHMQDFLVAFDNDEPVGMVGLEQFGEIGLLRSLYVDVARRRSGLGRQLVAALEAQASARGTSELWLLTIDADAWFSARGFVLRERDEAPAAIQATPEFGSLCPGDAFLMSKRY